MSTEKECAEKVMKNFANLGDLIFIAGIDKEKFPVIRNIIAQSSKYFEALLGPDFREGSQNEIELKGVDGPTLKAIICYIYCGFVELTKDNIEDILDAASSMELISLEEKCGKYLQENLTKESCVKTLILADKYSFGQLSTNALYFVCEHFENVPMAEVLQIESSSFNEILKNDKTTGSETQIFHCLVEWVGANVEERAKSVPEILKSVHLEFMPGEFLRTTAEPFYRQYGCADLLLAEYGKRMSASTPNRLRRNLIPLAKNIYFANVESSSSKPQINVYKYTSGNNWERIKNVLHPVSTNDHFGLVFCDKKLYFMGGFNKTMCYQKTPYGTATYHYSNDAEYHEMDSWNRKVLTQMNNKRSNFQPVVSGKYIYVFGGKNEKGCLQECERYSTVYNTWENVKAMPKKLSDCATIEVDGKIYLAGGRDESENFSNEIYCFEPINQIWTKKTSINGIVSGVLLAKLGPKLYVIINTRFIQTYDPIQDIWMEIGSLSAQIYTPIEYFGKMYAFRRNGSSGGSFSEMQLKNVWTFEGSANLQPFHECGLCFVY